MMKPILICIVGESGSGKTSIAEFIENEYDIHMIPSWTDREPRYEGEDSHTFISKEEFNEIKYEDMIAYTEFGGNRYCCLKSDVKPMNTYVIDERGIKYLKDNFSDDYEIISLRVTRDIEKRRECVDDDRIERDIGMFTLPFSYYDHVIDNCSDEINMLKNQVTAFIFTMSFNNRVFPMYYPIYDVCCGYEFIEYVLDFIFKKYVTIELRGDNNFKAYNEKFTYKNFHIFLDDCGFGCEVYHFITRLNEFVIKNDYKLKFIYEGLDLGANAFFIQPELIMFFYLIENNEYRFIADFSKHYSRKDLEDIMFKWGVPLDEVTANRVYGC